MKHSKLTWLGLALALAAFGSVAGSSEKYEGKKCRHDQASEIPAQQDWGKALPETLKITLLSAKKGEAEASSLYTSRETFGASFAMGNKKGGFEIEIGGHLVPRKDGSYEALIAFGAEGGEGKGGMELELQASVILKKGETRTFASTRDDQIQIRIDSVK